MVIYGVEDRDSMILLDSYQNHCSHDGILVLMDYHWTNEWGSVWQDLWLDGWNCSIDQFVGQDWLFPMDDGDDYRYLSIMVKRLGSTNLIGHAFIIRTINTDYWCCRFSIDFSQTFIRGTFEHFTSHWCNLFIQNYSINTSLWCFQSMKKRRFYFQTMWMVVLLMQLETEMDDFSSFSSSELPFVVAEGVHNVVAFWHFVADVLV